MNLANKITTVRVLLIPVFAVLLLQGSPPAGPLWATGCFLLASSTDKLDGVVARKYNMITTFGKFLDPLADKLLLTSAILCLTHLRLCSPYIGIVILSRELIVTSFRIVAMGKNVVLAADGWGKAKTFVQNLSVALVLGGMVFEPLARPGQWSLWLAAALTVYSGWHYLYANWSCIGDDW
ncbi:MAG: CDP-diacylglycerol--glycerol-3-phosphate 3-phosphatidyltransferase [Clostridiales bacterium]|nr:CDP-diacylglycerol--glycerol-3-phosphate 3-phosphatidyltransferase [Clostridiales bacterium]